MKRERPPEPGDTDSPAGASRADELAAVGYLASRLAGEMRQPLSVLRNAVFFLNEHIGSDLDGKARHHLTLVLRQVEELNGIAADLATLAGDDVAMPQEVDVETLIVAVLERVHARPGIVIETAVAPGAVLYGDPIQVRRAIAGIISNSIQAITGAGHVHIVCKDAGEETQIIISDTGPGMVEEVRARASDPFFTTSTHRVGIGLTVAKRLVGGSGGRLTVESTLGAGTTVTLTFPRRKRA